MVTKRICGKFQEVRFANQAMKRANAMVWRNVSMRNEHLRGSLDTNAVFLSPWFYEKANPNLTAKHVFMTKGVFNLQNAKSTDSDCDNRIICMCYRTIEGVEAAVCGCVFWLEEAQVPLANHCRPVADIPQPFRYGHVPEWVAHRLGRVDHQVLQTRENLRKMQEKREWFKNTWTVFPDHLGF